MTYTFKQHNYFTHMHVSCLDVFRLNPQASGLINILMTGEVFFVKFEIATSTVMAVML